MSIINRAMVDSEQILYPWLIYQTDSVRDIYVDPYVTAIVEVVQWSGDVSSFFAFFSISPIKVFLPLLDNDFRLERMGTGWSGLGRKVGQ